MSKNTFILVFIFVLFVVAIIRVNIFLEDENNKLKPVHVSVEDCNVQEKKCKISLEKFSVDVSIDENIYYLKKFDVDIFIKERKKIESVQIYFKMKNMNMGNNHFIFNKVMSDNKNQHWQTSALLPICVAGRADWFSELEVVTKNNKYIITFPILVEKK